MFPFHQDMTERFKQSEICSDLSELFTQGSCFHPVQQAHRHAFAAHWTHTHTRTNQSLPPGAAFGTTEGLAFNLSVLRGISLHFGVHADAKILRQREMDRWTQREK